ncbi:hypothetical protein JTB14_006747 [Gonioctena quinquepunctata]|nr:hypothetical protein JTB14_006747 [Gonioctena quinquepunctata]
MHENDANERSNTDTPVYRTILKILEEAAGTATVSGESIPATTCLYSPTHSYYVRHFAEDPYNSLFRAPNNPIHRLRQEPTTRATEAAAPYLLVGSLILSTSWPQGYAIPGMNLQYDQPPGVIQFQEGAPPHAADVDARIRINMSHSAGTSTEDEQGI